MNSGFLTVGLLVAIAAHLAIASPALAVQNTLQSVRCGVNEKFYPCSRWCEAKTCMYFLTKPNCPIVAASSRCTGVPKCDCIEHYARHSPNGPCIPEQDCLGQLIPEGNYDLNTPLSKVDIPTMLE